MSSKHRLAICFLSVLLALVGVVASGTWQHGAKLLHVWYAGVLAFFLFFFSILLFLMTRGRLVRSIWLVPVGAALSYPAFALAYVAYFAMFEYERTLNALRHFDLADIIVMSFLLLPTISVTWLFGGLAGLIVVIFERLLEHLEHKAQAIRS
jgi:hypothetical protein